MDNQDSLKPLIDGGTEGEQDNTAHVTLFFLTSLRLQGADSCHLSNNNTMY